MCSAQRLNAKMLSGLIERNQDICENIEAMTSGKDWAYNIDAGLELAVLKVADLLGGNVDDYIHDINLAADIANDLSDSQLDKWLGGFVKDNIVNIAGLIAIFASGPVGAAAIGITTVLGVANDVHRLKEHYIQLSNDKSNTDTDILIGMMTEIVLLAAPKGVSKYFKKLFELIQKGLKSSNKLVKNGFEAFVEVGEEKFDSKLQEN